MAMALEDVLLQRNNQGGQAAVYGTPDRDALVDNVGASLEQKYNQSKTTDIQQQIIAGAHQRGMDPATTLARFRQESNFNPYATGAEGEIGLGQIHPNTAASRHLDVTRLRTDPQYNIDSSLDYMQEHEKLYGPNDPRRIKAYNGLGEGGDPNYVAKVQGWIPEMQKLVASNAATTPVPQKPGLMSRVLDRMGKAQSHTMEAETAGNIGAGEAALGAATSIGGFFAGLGEMGSTILNATAAKVAARGPVTAETPGEVLRAQDGGFYTGLRKQFHDTMEKYSYSPRTEVGQKLLGIVGALPGAIQGGAEAAKSGLVSLGVKPEDADSIALSLELVGFLAIDPAVRSATKGFRATVARFKSLADKVTTDAGLETPEVVQAAKGLAEKVNASPDTLEALTQARQQLTDTLSKITTELPQRMTNALQQPIRGLNEVLRQRQETMPPPAQGELAFPPRAQGEFEFPRRPRPTAPELPAPTDTAVQVEARYPDEGLFAPGNRPGALVYPPNLPPPVSVVPRQEFRSGRQFVQQNRNIPAGQTAIDYARAQAVPKALEAPEVPMPEVAPGMVRLYRADLPVGSRGPETDFNAAHIANTDLNYVKSWRDANAPSSQLYYVDVPWSANDPMQPTPPTSITPQQRAQLLPVPTATTAPTIIPPREMVVRPKGSSDSHSRILDVIQRTPGIDTAGVVEYLGVSKRTVGIVLKRLETEGTIVKSADGKYTMAGQELSPSSKIESSDIPPTEPVIDTTPVITKPKRVRTVKKIAGETPTAVDSQMLSLEAARNEVIAIAHTEQLAHGMQLSDHFDVPAYVENKLAVPQAQSGLSSAAYASLKEAQKYFKQQQQATVPQIETPQLMSERYRPVNALADVNDVVTQGTTQGDATIPQKATLQIRTTNGVTDALLVNTTGMQTVQSLESIRSQVARGRMSEDIAQALESNLQRQARFGNVPLEQAHAFTGENLLGEATRIAYEKHLELYRATRTKNGLEYVQVPPEAIKTAIQLHEMNLLEPVRLSKEDAAAYVADKTRPIGSVTIEEISRALEAGEDISARLPEEAREHFSDMLAANRSGMNKSTARSYAEILHDLLDVIAPGDQSSHDLGSLAIFGLTPARKAAAMRLWADAQKAGQSFKRVLDETNLPESEKILFMRYVDSTKKPDLPQGIDPRTMRMLPEERRSPIPQNDLIDPVTGKYRPEVANRPDPNVRDRIVSQRSEVITNAAGEKETIYYAPLYESEVKAIQQARELRDIQGLTTLFGKDFGKHSLLVPYHAMRRMGLLDPVMYAYRASERAYSRELGLVTEDLNTLAKAHNKASRERIGEYGYSNTLQGMNILIRNDRDIPTLNRSEQITYATMQRLLDETFFRINEHREATGQKLIEPLAEGEYIPFLRTFTEAERLGMGMNLLTDSAEHIKAVQQMLGPMQYPREKVRTGATYTAEFDSFKLLNNYMESALKQIHLAPFIEKMRELIDHPLPESVTSNGLDPRTGQRITPGPATPTWLLSEHKPGVSEFLHRWTDFLEHGSQPTFAPAWDKAAKLLMSNLAGALVGLSMRSGLVHIARLKGTFHQAGFWHTLGGIGDVVSDSMKYFFGEEGTKWQRNLNESQVLDTRTYQDTFNDLGASIIGRSPKDFMQALKDGRLRDVAHTFDQRVGSLWMTAIDKVIAHVAYNAGRRLGEEAKLSSSKLVNFADDLVVRSEGGTMPGDMAAIQYTTGGKMATEFHRFTINNWNFLIEDVFGAAGRKDIAQLLNRDPNKYLPAVVKSIATLVIANTALNVFYEDLLHMRTPLPAPVRELKHGINAGDSVLALAGRLAGAGLSEAPLIGPTAHGFGVGGALIDTIGATGKQLSGAKGGYQSFKEDDSILMAAARLYGSPLASLTGMRGSRQMGQIVKGIDRNEPLTSFYAPPQGGSKQLKRSGEGIMRLR